MHNFKKIFRYFLIYGLGRTIVKIAGRYRKVPLHYFFPKLFLKKYTKVISLIGCGQFGFSTISYFLFNQQGDKFLECYDIHKPNQHSCAKFWNFTEQDNPDKLISNPDCQLVYVASNHYSHTDYAIRALEMGKVVYIEKPVAVNYEQLNRILITIKNTESKLFAGYNRPFSDAIIQLKKWQPSKSPITLNCFVVGHKLERHHWYRNPQEGTRVCGNIGHWLDLAVHLLASRHQVPDTFHISLAYSKDTERDDNVAVSITTDFNDLITII